MKKLALTSLLLSALALSSASAFATEKVTSTKEIEVNLKKNNPTIPPIKSVIATPVQGIYEVVVNESDLFYTDKDGKYLFFGNMEVSENGKRTNLTENRIQELSAVDLKGLNFADAVQRKVGNGKNIIVTFEDPNCGYCKKLQPELDRLTDVTIYTFIIPILGPSSVEASKAIMCSKDKQKEWSSYFKTGVAPTAEKCDTSALDRNRELARKFKVNGTPALFFENGRSLKGYAPYDKLVETMSAPSVKK